MLPNSVTKEAVTRGQGQWSRPVPERGYSTPLLAPGTLKAS